MIRTFLAATALSMSALAAAASPPATSAQLLVIRQTVADYAKWRPAYDAHQSVRDAAGLSNCRVRTTLDNPNEVFVACDIGDLAKAKAFTTSQNLADAMKNAGVVGKPDFWFLAAER